MQLIHQNPFRVLGLPVTASTKEIEKRISELKMYLGIGKPVTLDTDFSFLSPIERSWELVRHASNQIENDEDRFYNSLFWFWNNNTADALALDVLKEGNIESAIRLLEKQVSNGNNLNESYSSAKNLSIIYMALGHNGHAFDHEKFYKGLYWTGKTMSDNFLKIFTNFYPNINFTYIKDRVENSFVDEVVKNLTPLIDVAGGVSLARLIPNFSTFPEETRRKVADRFVSRHFQTIEDALALSEKERKSNPEMANLAAKKLIDITDQPLTTILDTLDDYRSQNISDKIAHELYDCGIAYYNHHVRNDTGTDPGDESVKLVEHAKKLATSFSTKKIIDDNLPIIEKWVEGRQDREKQKLIKPCIENIYEIIDNVPDPDDVPISKLLKHAEDLIAKCTPNLKKIKSEIGSENELYIELSSYVVNHVLDFCIAHANADRKSHEVVEFFSLLMYLDMDSTTRERYQKNKKIIDENVKLEENLDLIANALQRVPDPSLASKSQTNQLPKMAEELLASVKNELSSLRSIDQKLYFDTSSAVADKALRVCIEYANRSKNMPVAIRLMNRIAKLDMNSELRAFLGRNLKILEKNKIALGQSASHFKASPEARAAFLDHLNNSFPSKESSANMKAQLSPKKNNSIFPPAPPQSTKSKCYIASMVYGHHDAPQVITLRRFRDNSLNKTSIGRLFIKIYYKYSPLLVQHFGKYKIFHLSAKFILDRIVRRIS